MLLALLCTSNATDERLVNASLSTNYCTLGDAITLSIDVNAIGNSCKPPDLRTIPTFIKNFSSIQDIADVKHSDEVTTYSWTIKPMTSGIIEITPLPIIFTDSETGKKQTIYSAPIPLQVKGEEIKQRTIAAINSNPDVQTIKPQKILFRQPVINSHQQYLWKKANAEMLSATTVEDFIYAAITYRQLIRAGARTGEIYYNLGTAFLHANHVADAWQALSRAERYAGGKPNIRQNMSIAANMLPGKNFASWTRTLFPWHFKLSINTRLYLTIICLAVTLLFLYVVLTKRKEKSPELTTLLILSVILFISFSTSVATSTITESADRNSEKQQTPNTKEHTSLHLAQPNVKTTGLPPPLPHNNGAGMPSPSTNTNHNDPATSASISCDTESPYINQLFNLTLTIKSDNPLHNEIEINNLPHSSILQRDPFKELPTKYNEVNGNIQETRQYICQARALKAGNTTFAPILSATQIKKGSHTAVSIATEPLKLTVKPLPAVDSEEGFSGAIGEFSIQSKISPTDASPTDLIKITTTIDGTGYMPEEYLPRISHAPDFIIYDPKRINAGKKTRIFEQFLAPLSSKEANIPTVEFRYFNPDSGKYILCTNRLFTLK